MICLRAAACDRVGDKPKLSFLGTAKASNPFLNFVRGQWGRHLEMKRGRDEAAGVSAEEPIDAGAGSVSNKGAECVRRKLRAAAETSVYVTVRALVRE